MGLRNSVRQQQDSAVLGQQLQQTLRQKLAAQPMQVRCVIRDNTLLVLAEHLLHIEPNREATFSSLEAALRELQPEMASEPGLMALKSLPVQLFLRIAGYQRPYASHKFQLNLTQAAQPVTPPARRPESDSPAAVASAASVAVPFPPVVEPSQFELTSADVTAPVVQPEDAVSQAAQAELAELVEVEPVAPAGQSEPQVVESTQADPEASLIAPSLVEAAPVERPVAPEEAELAAAEVDRTPTLELETVTVEPTAEPTTVEPTALAEAEPEAEPEAVEAQTVELTAPELASVALSEVALSEIEPSVSLDEPDPAPDLASDASSLVEAPSTAEVVLDPEPEAIALDAVAPSIDLAVVALDSVASEPEEPEVNVTRAELATSETTDLNLAELDAVELPTEGEAVQLLDPPKPQEQLDLNRVDLDPAEPVDLTGSITEAEAISASTVELTELATVEPIAVEPVGLEPVGLEPVAAELTSEVEPIESAVFPTIAAELSELDSVGPSFVDVEAVATSGPTDQSVVLDEVEQSAIEIEPVAPIAVEPIAVEPSIAPDAAEPDAAELTAPTDAQSPDEWVQAQTEAEDEPIGLEALIAEVALTGVAVEAVRTEANDPVELPEQVAELSTHQPVFDSPDGAASATDAIATAQDAEIEADSSQVPSSNLASLASVESLEPAEADIDELVVSEVASVEQGAATATSAEGLVDSAVSEQEGVALEGPEAEAIGESSAPPAPELGEPQLSETELVAQNWVEPAAEVTAEIAEPEVVETFAPEAIEAAPPEVEAIQPEAVSPFTAWEVASTEPDLPYPDLANSDLATSIEPTVGLIPDQAELLALEPNLESGGIGSVAGVAASETGLEGIASLPEPDPTVAPEEIQPEQAIQQNWESPQPDWAIPDSLSEPEPDLNAAPEPTADAVIQDAAPDVGEPELESAIADQMAESEAANLPYLVPDPWLAQAPDALTNSEPVESDPVESDPVESDPVESDPTDEVTPGLPDAIPSEVVVTAVMDWLNHQMVETNTATDAIAESRAETGFAEPDFATGATEPDLLIHELTDADRDSEPSAASTELQEPEALQPRSDTEAPHSSQVAPPQSELFVPFGEELASQQPDQLPSDQVTDSYFDEQAIFSESPYLPDDSSDDSIEIGGDLDTTEIEPAGSPALDPAEPATATADAAVAVEAPTRASYHWAMGGVIGAVALAGGIYMLSRPCVVGGCEQIQLSQDLNQTALATVQSTDSALDVVDAYKQLNEANYLLGTIPFWSPHYKTAQSLLASYETQSASLGQVVEALEQANTAAKRSQNPPHPLQEWREVQWLWREVVEKLEKVPAGSVAQGLAQRKLQEYKTNLATINQRVIIEQQAQNRITAARQVGQRAEAQAGAAQSAENWQETATTWNTAIEQLRQIPSGTNAHDEAQQLLAVYQPKRTQAVARQGQEQTSATAYTQAVEAAERARRLEQQNQWVAAAEQWQNALTFAQRVPADSAYYSQVQPLINTYSSTLQQAQVNSQRSSAIQTAKSEFDQACDGSPTVCTYTLSPQAIRVQFTPVYDQTVARLITNTQGNNGFPTAVVNQVNGLLRSLADISDLTQVPIELYNSNGTKLGTYTPALAGYVPQQ